MEVFFPPIDDYGNKLIRTRFSMGKTTCMLWRYFLSKLIAEAEINKMANVVETQFISEKKNHITKIFLKYCKTDKKKKLFLVLKKKTFTENYQLSGDISSGEVLILSIIFLHLNKVVFLDEG